jgi:uncharacterized protein YjiS (DUF1127 family)
MTFAQRIWKDLPFSELSIRHMAARIRLWRQRARSRRDLLWLSEHQLRDIGIDRRAARTEAYKPFWRP